MTFEIMVVDDSVRAGETFAKLIQATTGLQTIFTEDPRQAVELVKEHPIKVAVLDQRMPKKTGTALFGELKLLNPELRGVLFSGEAEREDLAEALRAGFIDALDKNDVSQLAGRVWALYVEALADIASRQYASPQRIGEYRPGLMARPRVTVDILAFEDSPGSPKEVWLESDLFVAVRLESGQTKRISRSRISESELIREDESKVTRSRSAGVSAGLSLTNPIKANVGSQLQSKLESVLRERAQERQLIRFENVEEEVFELPLPTSVDDPRAREIVRAPIYRRMRAVIRISCECCNADKYEIVNVKVFTGRFHTRHVDQLGDGTTKVVDFP